ncbi:MAG: DUF1232 domain-containing protein [Verrucomicrobiales bacterium]|nr:DUF1232 domain-containing protein [Verrucomicrobiales bacterium]
MKKFIEVLVMLVLGVISLIYLMVGATDFIPDVIPVIGNLDDAAATTILVGVLSYFGFDLTRFFRKMGVSAKAGKAAEGEVIDAEAVRVEKKDGE